MHITLIDPPRYTFPLNHASNVAIPPLGIAYIASSIESNGDSVHVIDSVGSALTNYTKYGPVYLRGLEFDDHKQNRFRYRYNFFRKHVFMSVDSYKTSNKIDKRYLS